MDNTAKVWDLNSLRCRYTLRGHADSVNSIEFLPFSNTLLTCSADKTLSLWDARTVSSVYHINLAIRQGFPLSRMTKNK